MSSWAEQQFSPPEWLLGPTASVLSVLFLFCIISRVLVFSIGEDKVGDWMTRVRERLTRSTTLPLYHDASMVGLTLEPTKRKKKVGRRRKPKRTWTMFLLGGSDDEMDDDIEAAAGPFGLDDEMWLQAPKTHVATEYVLDQQSSEECATPVGDGDVYDLGDKEWCVPESV
eukprot:TRINITY_DN1542_c0_g1_i3.p1 TRINITY_DN1542_c0_g1~~TRINITY_DN1542_c0_g1_i3.p1  ORF type:complete len:170 (-),score=40.72 TRINITY_DN1542_c0_g1_i3:245-754(-)